MCATVSGMTNLIGTLSAGATTEAAHPGTKEKNAQGVSVTH
jgi:hypothetical protein